MIELTEDFKCDRDKFQWILYERHKNANPKTGEMATTWRKSFYATLPQMIAAMMDRSAKKAGDMPQVLRIFEQIRDEIVAAVERMNASQAETRGAV